MPWLKEHASGEQIKHKPATLGSTSRAPYKGQSGGSRMSVSGNQGIFYLQLNTLTADRRTHIYIDEAANTCIHVHTQTRPSLSEGAGR